VLFLVIIHFFCKASEIRSIDCNRFINICVGSFSCEVESALIHEQSLLILEEEQSAIQMRTFQGTIKQMLATSDIEGQPLGMQLCGSFLTVATAAGWIKIWNLSRRYDNGNC
jgi:intraflagellar transport protein 140